MTEVPSHGSSDYVELFVGVDEQWYWHRRARNGEIVSTGGEGFVDKHYASEAAVRVNPGVALRWQPPPEGDEDDAVR